jgi:hypothetical protein
MAQDRAGFNDLLRGGGGAHTHWSAVRIVLSERTGATGGSCAEYCFGAANIAVIYTDY